MGGGGTRTRLGPEGFEEGKDTGLLSGEPERTGQTEIDGGGGERDGGGTVLDEGGDALGGAKVRLIHDAGLATDAGAFHDVVIEPVGFFLGDERGYTG